jgi:hypothetical protein
MDRARYAVEERHHPDPVAARSEEPGGGPLVVLVDDPAHVVATTVDPIPGIARPDGAQWSGQLGGGLGQGGLVVRHHPVRRMGHPGRFPDRVGEHLVLQRQERRRAAERHRPTVDRLVAGDER